MGVRSTMLDGTISSGKISREEEGRPMMSREEGSVVWGAGIAKRVTDTEEAGESWREGGRGGVEGGRGGVEGGSLWRGLTLRRLEGAGESGSSSTSCEVWEEEGGRRPRTEDKGGIITLGIPEVVPGVETARVEGPAWGGGSDLGSTETGLCGLVGRAGRERGGREAPGNSHLNLREAHRLQATRRVEVIEMMQATMCFSQ